MLLSTSEFPEVVLYPTGADRRNQTLHFSRRIQVNLTPKRRKPCSMTPCERTAGFIRVLQENMRHDVMFFSSLFEGFGLVLPEAMPCRASAIRTPHEAAPDSISEDASIARIRDVEVMGKKPLSGNRDPLATASRVAMRQTAPHSWAHGRQSSANSVPQAFAESTPAAHSSICRRAHVQVCQPC